MPELLALLPEAIVLEEARAKRHFEVEFTPPGGAHVEFTVGSPVETDDGITVTSACEVTLKSGEDVLIAEIATSFVVLFASSEEKFADPDFRNAALIAAHPYHRKTIIDLTEQFDIPTFRLDFSVGVERTDEAVDGTEVQFEPDSEHTSPV